MKFKSSVRRFSSLANWSSTPSLHRADRLYRLRIRLSVGNLRRFSIPHESVRLQRLQSGQVRCDQMRARGGLARGVYHSKHARSKLGFAAARGKSTRRVAGTVLISYGL